MNPVWIATKGRANKPLTTALLDSEDVPYTLAVEPQDEAAYRAAYPSAKLAVLEANDQGLAYVRNAILSQNAGPFWMLDDDIQKFGKTVGNRNVKVGAREALEGAEALFAQQPMVAHGALEYWQYAWSSTKPYTLNSYCDVCVWIDASRVKSLRFRPETNLKADRDFTLQVLALGYDTMRVQAYSFAAPENGSNAGGLQAEYQASVPEQQSVAAMVRLWPGIVQHVVKKNGRHDAKINWRALRKPI